MERNPGFAAGTMIKLLLVAMTLVGNSGCVGLVSALLYKGRMTPASCKELKGKRVAVICIGDSGDFGPNPNAGLLARRIGRLLKENVREIDLVSPQQIDAWMDEHDVDFVDYVAIGKGVKAEMVVVVDLKSFYLQDSDTLYKGQAECKLQVFDVADGDEIYAPYMPPTIYPRMQGLPTSGVSSEQFRQKFIDVLATDIAVHFYAHDQNEQIAIDTPDLPVYR